MTTTNARGAIRNFNATPNGDIVRSYAITDAGVAHDLSSSTLNIKVMDGDTSGNVLATYAQTVTNEAGGLFTFKIPKTLFLARHGEELYYELILTESGNDVTYQSGIICVAEAI